MILTFINIVINILIRKIKVFLAKCKFLIKKGYSFRWMCYFIKMFIPLDYNQKNVFLYIRD